MSTMPPPPPPSSVPPGYQAYAPGQAMNYASWGARVGGYILNGLAGVLFGLPAMISFFAGPREYKECTIDGEAGLCKLPTSSGWAIFAVLAAVGAITYYVMYCKAVGSTGQFWGHRGAGVRIVDATTGGPIGAGRAFGRQLAHFIDAMPCYLGFLWPLWDAKKQTFADKIVGTVSIRA
ncbi:MAG: RDD family protein [Actinobacteria bacterium]|nr:RDD family protein [Actinomycetota bacterium]